MNSSTQLAHLNRKPPVSTAFLMWTGCEIVCPLICQLMGKHDERCGSFWPGAATAVDIG